MIKNFLPRTLPAIRALSIIVNFEKISIIPNLSTLPSPFKFIIKIWFLQKSLLWNRGKFRIINVASFKISNSDSLGIKASAARCQILNFNFSSKSCVNFWLNFWNFWDCIFDLIRGDVIKWSDAWIWDDLEFLIKSSRR